jgi:hypothetical protein
MNQDLPLLYRVDYLQVYTMDTHTHTNCIMNFIDNYFPYSVQYNHVGPVAYPGILFWGGGSTNSVEDRENGDLGAVAP